MTAEKFAAEFAQSMERAGYEPSDTLTNALKSEYATITEFDKDENEGAPEGDGYSTIPYFLDALAHAAGRIASHRN